MPVTLVTAFAHPDDETFSVGGSVARAVAAGARVTAICATRGEVGEIADPSLATPETLGEVREAELRAACAELGVTDVRFLGHRDSGMEGTPENQDPRALAQADDDAVAAELVALFTELRADVVVTFEPGGVYGHPDHRKISRCATLAFDRAAHDGWAPARLLYAGVARSRFAELRRMAKEAGLPENPLFEQVKDFGMPDEDLTTTIDVTPWVQQKRRALARHRTQINPWLAALPEPMLLRLLGGESFAQVRGAITDASRADLIADL